MEKQTNEIHGLLYPIPLTGEFDDRDYSGQWSVDLIQSRTVVRFFVFGFGQKTSDTSLQRHKLHTREREESHFVPKTLKKRTSIKRVLSYP